MTDPIKQAIEALKGLLDYATPTAKAESQGLAAIAALEGLKKAEPVAWQWLDTGVFRKKIPESAHAPDWNPMYRHPAPKVTT